MARAKMSEPHTWTVVGDWLAVEAEREVTAILAETEDETGEGPSPFNPRASVRGFYVDLGSLRTNPGLVARHYGRTYAEPHAAALLSAVTALSEFVEG